MRKAHRVSVLCIFLSFFVSIPVAFAESDAKSPDLGSGALGGCTDEGCEEEIFRSARTEQVCVRFDATNGGIASLKYITGNTEQPIIESNELVARTLCLHASSLTLHCLSFAGLDGQCLYRIVKIK
jgi:hypothetical protein